METTQTNRETRIKTPLGEDVLLLRTMTMNEELGRLRHKQYPHLEGL